MFFPGETAIVDDRLMEPSVGVWDGLDHTTVRRRWPTYDEETIDLMLTHPGGESLCGRVKSFLLDLAGAADDSHAGHRQPGQGTRTSLPRT